MLTDSQFEKLLERQDKRYMDFLQAVLPSREDRDRLIKIETTQQNTMLLMSTTRSEDLLKIGAADTKATKAHTRIDSVARWAIVSYITTFGGVLLSVFFFLSHKP